MHTPTHDPTLVATDGTGGLAGHVTAPAPRLGKQEAKARLAEHVAVIAERQRMLYAHSTHAVLLVVQGMDASGKDSTIRHVLSGVNPAGCAVWSFKQPGPVALDHDFLWRCQERLPARGTIGVFNRSHYEEVLVVRVHPELLRRSRMRASGVPDDLWSGRFRSIRDWELHLADNGTVIRKVFLYLSKDEQRRRLLRRLERPDKHWKFDPSDLSERGHWDDYIAAYEDALRETSRPWAPWYAVPADHKPSAREAVARIMRHTLEELDLRWPSPPDPAVLEAARHTLLSEEG